MGEGLFPGEKIENKGWGCSFVVFLIIGYAVYSHFLQKDKPIKESYETKSTYHYEQRNTNNACYYVIAYNANIRKWVPESVSEKNVVRQVQQNTRLCVTEKIVASKTNFTRDWYKVSLHGENIGWVSSALLSEYRVVQGKCDSSSNRFSVVSETGLFVRQGIDDLPNSRIIGLLLDDSSVCPIEQRNVDFSGWANIWVKIKLTNGDIGWVAKKYLNER